MSPTASTYSATQERGTILVMVVGVLVMLFIVGSSLLIVARSERQAVKGSTARETIENVALALIEPILDKLREDAVGTDGIPYNAGWVLNGGDPSLGEDYADFVGRLLNDIGNPSKLRRNGDLLLSSPEPFYDGSNWSLYATSWALDTIPIDASVWPADNPIAIGPLANPKLDADADHIQDSSRSYLLESLGQAFGGNFRMELRILPTSDKVMIDRFTHPSLLMQVIHPNDGITDPVTELYANGTPLIDETELRRRFMLPRYIEQTEYNALPNNDLRRLLPATLRYDRFEPDAQGRLIVADWNPVDGNTHTWNEWLTRVNPASNNYDRRHLITKDSYDDGLRRQRDEQLLHTVGGVPSELQLFYYVINPSETVLPAEAYGLESGNLWFNSPGLRSQFSLRDVLESDGSASYRRAVQLTAYYLAMIQHTSVPPNDQLEQLRTAAQLAVNTIDFADFDDPEDDSIDNHIPSRFSWTNGTLAVDVVGVEKQPFITEAYAKLVLEPKLAPDDTEWNPEPTGDSVYAIELYNPYGTDLPLVGYELRGLGAAGADVDLSTITVPAYNYVVISSHLVDPNSTIPGNLGDGNEGTNLFHELNLRLVDEAPPFGPLPIRLVRTDAEDLQGGPSVEIVVDRLDPVGLGAPDGWATINPPPNVVGTHLVRDSSLQRHKEVAGTPPVYWHCTLARQMLFPLPWDEDDVNNAAVLLTNRFRAPQHNLLGTGRADNKDVMDKEFSGVPFSVPDPNVISPRPDSTVDFAVKLLPIAPFPIVTSDIGIGGLSSTGGTLAFPTTGSLLLVTRYAHLPGEVGVTEDEPVTVAATREPPGVLRPGATDEQRRLVQMMQLDNGHLPVFHDHDPLTAEGVGNDEKCTDNINAEGRLDVPWGQLVFDYFTALPREELVRVLDLSGVLGWPPAVRLIETLPADYELAYATLFPYPLIEQVSTETAVTIGPRIRGRINVNLAPWSVLDGLPMLSDEGSSGSVDLPVPELHYDNLDPDPAGVPGVPGRAFVNILTEEVRDVSNYLLYTNASQTLAKAMVAYRERRSLYRTDGALDFELASFPDAPGFLTPGALCDLIPRIRLDDPAFSVGPGITIDRPTLDQLRTASYMEAPPNVSTTVKPYSYLGYLQYIAPVVRLQDWVTVKNHVFTLYSTVGKDGLWVRSQVTVDRTRCLYSNELPVRIAETGPIGYHNAVDD